MDPGNPVLDDYILAQSKCSLPKVCFVPTASGDAEGYIEEFYRNFKSRACVATHLSLLKPACREIESFVLEQDVIYVGGGHTRKMLDLWRERGLDGVLQRAWRSDIILAGVSAGAMCWFEEGLTGAGGQFTPMACLGFLPGSHCPHYDTAEARRHAYRRLILEGCLKEGLAADDGVALHFVGSQLKCAVSSRPKAHAYRVRKVNSEIVEEAVETRYLESP